MSSRHQPPRPESDPEPLDYLRDDDETPGLGLTIQALISTERMREAGLPPHQLSHGNAAAAMYWTAAQIVAHHSCNGCNLQPGDLIGTGTLSVDSEDGLGSLLEISRGGKRPLTLPNGESRSFLEDHDLGCFYTAPGCE